MKQYKILYRNIQEMSNANINRYNIDYIFWGIIYKKSMFLLDNTTNGTIESKLSGDVFELKQCIKKSLI